MGKPTAKMIEYADLIRHELRIVADIDSMDFDECSEFISENVEAFKHLCDLEYIASDRFERCYGDSGY